MGRSGLSSSGRASPSGGLDGIGDLNGVDRGGAMMSRATSMVQISDLADLRAFEDAVRGMREPSAVEGTGPSASVVAPDDDDDDGFFFYDEDDGGDGGSAASPPIPTPPAVVSPEPSPPSSATATSSSMRKSENGDVPSRATRSRRSVRLEGIFLFNILFLEGGRRYLEGEGAPAGRPSTPFPSASLSLSRLFPPSTPVYSPAPIVVGIVVVSPPPASRRCRLSLSPPYSLTEQSLNLPPCALPDILCLGRACNAVQLGGPPPPLPNLFGLHQCVRNLLRRVARRSHELPPSYVRGHVNLLP